MGSRGRTVQPDLCRDPYWPNRRATGTTRTKGPSLLVLRHDSPGTGLL